MNVKRFAKIAMIAAIYTAVSLALAPLSFGNIQIRIAEALTVLPILYEPSIWGVTLGCFLTNLIGAITGVNPTGMLDAVIGTSATFLAAISTFRLRRYTLHDVPVWSLLMPVLFNFVFVGIELGFLLFPGHVIAGSLICGAEVAVGELAAVVLGWLLVKYLRKTSIFKE